MPIHTAIMSGYLRFVPATYSPQAATLTSFSSVTGIFNALASALATGNSFQRKLTAVTTTPRSGVHRAGGTDAQAADVLGSQSALGDRLLHALGDPADHLARTLFGPGFGLVAAKQAILAIHHAGLNVGAAKVHADKIPIFLLAHTGLQESMK